MLRLLYCDFNEELQKVSCWLQVNRLSLNTDKTKYLLFTHSVVDTSLSINIDNSLISQEKDFKFLGVTIDNRLNYNLNIQNLSRKLSCVVGITRKLSYFRKLINQRRQTKK